jgi:hypothetical protein
MAYWNVKNTIGNNSRHHESGFSQKAGNVESSEFYEIEEGVVLDVILDATHPDIKNIVAEEWPDDFKGEIAKSTDKNYTYIGRIKFRLLHSQNGVPKEKLSWAKPTQTFISEYPLVNEVVLLTKIRNDWYYTRRLNLNGLPNNNANFDVEKTEGNTSGNRLENINNTTTFSSVIGPLSYIGPKSIKSANNKGVLGSYFTSNNKIRSVKKYEGDSTIESRYGQSIRFTSYNNIRKNDTGDSKYPDYKGCGNPSIIIRNRQRPLGNKDKDTQLHPLLPAIPKMSDVEKNAGGIIEEDINNDGSSIHITSGLVESNWKTTVYKTIFCTDIPEEQPKFSPTGCTTFTKPILTGDQIVINTDRLIFSSRFNESLHYSKKRYSVVTDSEYTVDAHDQIVMTTNKKTVINSPAIYLGQYDETNEPALLGQTTVDWMYDLCEWLKAHVHWYKHVHRNSPGPTPDKTQIPVQIADIEALQARLKPLLSKRVFITGGGYATGANGAEPKNTDSNVKPTVIDVTTGNGVPGGFHGKNSRKLNK